MNKLQKLREERAAQVDKMDKACATAKSEDREMTESEVTAFDEADAAIKEIDKKIASASRFEKAASEKSNQERIIPAASRNASIPRIPGDGAPREFDSMGEFIHAVRFRQNDPRLASLFKDDVMGHEMRGEQRMDTGSSGGFAVPTQFREELLMVDPEEAVVRPRATIIAAGDPPDSEISMPALNQGAGSNRYGGVSVSWIGEGDDKPETTVGLKEITLKPYEAAATLVVTDKLLRNWKAANSILPALLTGAMRQEEDYQFLRGDGNKKPLGLFNSGAVLSVNRTTANRIKFADVSKMMNQFKGKNPVWLCAKYSRDQLVTLEDTQGHLVWTYSAREGLPDTLMGIPVIFTELQPALGTKGDLALVSLSDYLIKDGSGPFVAASEHVLFRQNKTVIKISWNVDGQAWLNGPLVGRDGNNYSPFILLDIPAA